MGVAVLSQGGWGGDREWRRLQESLVEIVEAEVDYDLWVTGRKLPRRGPWLQAAALSHTVRKALKIGGK